MARSETGHSPGIRLEDRATAGGKGYGGTPTPAPLLEDRATAEACIELAEMTPTPAL
ncbi:MAG: hypothetical protein H6658_07055 [Ardenticatenaceae bacterium]|nr:hypothetical protein [Ardenticatenaceae bacterium]